MHSKWPTIDRLAVATLALITGIIHLSIAPGDWGEAHVLGLAFFGMAAAFFVAAMMLPGTEDRRFDYAVIVFSLGVSALYVLMRALPANPITHEKEHFELLGNISVALQLAMSSILWFMPSDKRRAASAAPGLPEGSRAWSSSGSPHSS
jgi:hypothetical protein